MAYTGLPITIFNAITATPTAPYEFVLSGQKGIKVETSGTSTSRTITFTGKVFETSVAKTFIALNMTTGDLVTATGATGNNEVFDLSGLEGMYSVLVNATAIAGGNLTIMGKVY